LGLADLSLFDPEAVFEDDVLPDNAGETFHGHEGIARAVQRWSEPYESLTVELEQIVGTGDRLVSIHRIRARARYTGMDLDAPLAYVWTFQEGKVIHFRSFANPKQALNAAGLKA